MTCSMEELEMKKIAEERRREKMEDRLARERVKKQIEADKLVSFLCYQWY